MALASQDHGAILERRESLKLLVSAATRRMFAMVQEVDRQRAIIRSRADHSSRRRDELLKSGVPYHKLEYVMGAAYDPTEDLARLAALETERDALGRFVADGPVYDTGLLAGTIFEGREKLEQAEFDRMFPSATPSPPTAVASKW